MISLSHPVVDRFVADSAWPPLADWLTDQGATAEDLALLYAGTPPAHADGISRECLALWLECQGSREQAEAVRAEAIGKWRSAWDSSGRPGPMVLVPYAGGSDYQPPADIVRFPNGYWCWAVHNWAVGTEPSRGLAMQAAEESLRDAQRSSLYPDGLRHRLGPLCRDLRRRVLSLPWAAGVRATRACSRYFYRHDVVGREHARAAVLRQMRPQVSVCSRERDDATNLRRVIWSAYQTLTAPQLIWP